MHDNASACTNKMQRKQKNTFIHFNACLPM